MFDFKKIDDFNKHINISIPNYNGLIDVLKCFIQEYVHPKGRLIDIGCSDGSLINSIHKRSDCEYIGIDIINILKYDIDFIKGDAVDIIGRLDNIDLITSIFTLQFMGKRNRKKLLLEIKYKMQEVGCSLIVAEKVFFDTRIDNILKKRHIQEKRCAFSDKEILDKEMALFGSMYCLTDNELKQELEELGNVVSIWQSYNFIAYIVTPNSEG